MKSHLGGFRGKGPGKIVGKRSFPAKKINDFLI